MTPDLMEEGAQRIAALEKKRQLGQTESGGRHDG